MKINTVFSNFIAQDFLNIDNDALAIYCKEKYQEQQELNPKYSCYLNFDAPEVKPLFSVIEKNLKFLHHSLGLTPNSRQELTKAWVNVNNNIFIDGAHSHPGFFFSGVYYVKSDQLSGSINFLNPNRELLSTIPPPAIAITNSFNSAIISHAPIPGKLLIFPSWLIHYVEHNFGDSERISIAFNTRIIMPEGLMANYK
jgi:uncharacterized protein (TIGR02466 family)